MSNTSNRIYGLDVMRSAAIIMVLCSHVLYIFSGFNNALTGLLQLIGVQGVEVFFILSGFLIGNILYKTLHKSTLSFQVIKKFWIRRWYRTLPLYFLILIINILIYYIVYGFFPDEIYKYFIFLQNFSFEHLVFFPESWSLSVEEFSYLIAPIAIFCLSKLIKEKSKLFLWTSILLILVFILLKVEYYLSHNVIAQDLMYWNANLKPIVIYRLDTIFYGFCMVYVFHKYRAQFKFYKNHGLAFGVFLYACLNCYISLGGHRIQDNQLFWNVLYLPLNSISIALTLPYLYYLKSPSTIIKVIITKVSQYSYAIYLTHYTLVLYVLNNIFPFYKYNFYGKCLYTIGYLTITVIISALLFYGFEQPIMRFRDKKFPKN